MRAAVESGATVWNAGEFYGTPEYNSMTVIKAYFEKYPDDAAKVSLYIKGAADLETLRPDGSPENVRRSLDAIIEQLGGVKKVDGFAPARRDPRVSLEVTMGVIQREYVDTGKIGGVYVSECSVETIKEASKYVRLVAAEVEVSMFSPDILANGVAATCAQLDIPILAYSPIGRGVRQTESLPLRIPPAANRDQVLSGRFTNASQFKELGHVSQFPRVQQDALDHNLQLVRQVEALATKRGCTAAQLAINWVRGLSGRPGIPAVVPIPGASTAERVTENAQVIVLSDEELRAIGDLMDEFDVLGARYPDYIPIET